MLIGVTGTNGGGKGAVVDYLERHKGFVHFSVRDLLVEELTKQGLPVDRPHMGELATRWRQEHGSGYFTDTFLARAGAVGATNILIESIRTIAEARNIQNHGGIMLAVDAPLELRYARIVGRGTHTDRVSLEEFRAQEDAEYRSANPSDPTLMNVLGVMEIADETISNDGTVNELHEKIDALLARHAH